ncbi:MAG: TIGR04283 family arsenosugar biosynthesis glycosyltransferase [Planctomycetota bacterium]|jgi:rSAM/selenodomain-associated transferase 2
MSMRGIAESLPQLRPLDERLVAMGRMRRYSSRMRPITGSRSDSHEAVAHDRISVVIPARDEAATIGGALAQLAGADVAEVIVADGQSVDATIALARAAGARVVTAPPGRGGQLNAGAAAATGDVLLFLHADTRLPADFARHVREILARRGTSAGAFRLRVEAPNRSLRLIERVVNWRSSVLQRPYGDQGLFVAAATFREVGGYPDQPLLEDVEIARRLRRIGRIDIAPVAIRTSARRWLACGVWRTTIQNQACLLASRLGVRPARIAAWRRRSLARRLRRSVTRRDAIADAPPIGGTRPIQSA